MREWLRVVVVGVVAGCGGSQSHTGHRAHAAARPVGCEVETLREGVPARPTRLEGQVVARCTRDQGDEAHCLRQLQDEACRLGGTVLWDVRTQPLELTEGIEMRAAAGTYR
ncbi:MAG: hypothetical protein WCJ30_27455 [Deltaproteobacteria bacterium]